MADDDVTPTAGIGIRPPFKLVGEIAEYAEALRELARKLSTAAPLLDSPPGPDRDALFEEIEGLLIQVGDGAHEIRHHLPRKR